METKLEIKIKKLLDYSFIQDEGKPIEYRYLTSKEREILTISEYNELMKYARSSASLSDSKESKTITIKELIIVIVAVLLGSFTGSLVFNLFIK